MWKVSWLYEKAHNIANFGGYAAILNPQKFCPSKLPPIWYLQCSATKNYAETKG